MYKYEIWQLRRDCGEDDFRKYAFSDFDSATKDGAEINKELYSIIYSFDSEKELMLDDIFCTFNILRPTDFTGHSLSVSDVVKTPDGYWYCDSFGWKKLDWRD